MLDANFIANIKHFAEKMQGVPFRDRGRNYSGLDCWGLIWLAYRDCLGLDLPGLEDIPALQGWQAGDRFELIRRQHREIQSGQERPGDVAVFRGLPVHVGLVVAPGHVLHVESGLDTCVEPFYRGPLKLRLMGIFRHAELA